MTGSEEKPGKLSEGYGGNVAFKSAYCKDY
jgi:hypothetical protein